MSPAMACDSVCALDPYALLGVTIHSTCQEVRRRYYQLACICHPDRGGTADQMRTLHNAYQFVSRGNALTGTSTFEDLQLRFDEFCSEQTSEPPRFVDIHADVHQNSDFHSAFERSEQIDGAFAEGGYATAPSEYTASEAGYVPKVSGAVVDFDRQVTVYAEPTAVVQPRASLRDLENTRLDDYSVFVGKLHVSDYKEGLAPPQELEVDGIDESRDVTAEFTRLRDMRHAH